MIDCCVSPVSPASPASPVLPMCHILLLLVSVTGFTVKPVKLSQDETQKTQVVEPSNEVHLGSSSSEDEASGNNTKQDILDEISKSM